MFKYSTPESYNLMYNTYFFFILFRYSEVFLLRTPKSTQIMPLIKRSNKTLCIANIKRKVKLVQKLIIKPIEI